MQGIRESAGWGPASWWPRSNFVEFKDTNRSPSFSGNWRRCFPLGRRLSNGERHRRVGYARAATFHGVSGDPLDWTKARDCIINGLSAMEGFDAPLAAWRVHATAFELYQNSGDRNLAKRQLLLSRDTIMKLANSMPAEEPLRTKFLSAPAIRKTLGACEAQDSRSGEA